tara:strand:+ start:6711 stop:7025 length:315 start_codon:yes stop_codon:yes gene_type:complete
MLVALMDYIFVMMVVSAVVSYLPLGKYFSEMGTIMFSLWGFISASVLALGTYKMDFVTDNATPLFSVETEYFLAYYFVGFALLSLVRFIAVSLKMLNGSYVASY